LYDRQKRRIIEKYPCFTQYFNDVENRIVEDPNASSEEFIIYQDRHIHARKRSVKTTFFSGLLPDQYMYLTLMYALTKDGKIVILFLSLRTYTA
jgi:hypothetical protein